MPHSTGNNGVEWLDYYEIMGIIYYDLDSYQQTSNEKILDQRVEHCSSLPNG